MLAILEREQLPKLKNLFDIPITKLSTRNTHHNSQLQLQQTPLTSNESSSKLIKSQNSELTSNKSFLKQVEAYSGKSLLSYLVGSNEKNNQLNNSLSKLINQAKKLIIIMHNINYFFQIFNKKSMKLNHEVILIETQLVQSNQ